MRAHHPTGYSASHTTPLQLAREVYDRITIQAFPDWSASPSPVLQVDGVLGDDRASDALAGNYQTLFEARSISFVVSCANRCILSPAICSHAGYRK